MADTASVGAVVEQAKGVIMLRYGVGSDESLAAMARWAGEADVTVDDLARALVEGVCQGRVTPETECMVRWLEQRLRARIDEPPPPATEPVVLRRRSAGAPARQWRYPSAVHAARAVSST